MLPNIPVLPLSYAAARTILSKLGGPPLPKDWQEIVKESSQKSPATSHKESNATAVKSPEKMIHNIGGNWSEKSGVTKASLQTFNKLQNEKMINIHAWLPAVDTTKVVHIGASRGNTGGAKLGMASLLALASAMSSSFPRGTGRRVMFSVWADSHGALIGSTEFAQLYGELVSESGLAYLDIGDSVGSQRGLRVQATPLLHEAVREAAHFVSWPEQEAVSVLEGWRMGKGKEYVLGFEKIGCSSNSASFSDMLGVPSAMISVAQPHHPSQCLEDKCYTCYKTREEHPLTGSQYDTPSALDALDPKLDWSTSRAALVGVVALVLSESVVIPLDLKADFTGNLLNGWWSFLHHHIHHFNTSPYNFTSILDAIHLQLYKVQIETTKLYLWYRKSSNNADPYVRYRHDEDRVNFFLHVSRLLLGPRGLGRKFTNVLAGHSFLPEDPWHTHDFENTRISPDTSGGNMLNDPSKNNSLSGEQIPENRLKIQTNSAFAESRYNTLSFAPSYLEENKRRPHIWYPYVTRALARAVANESTWDEVGQELSLVYSMLLSFSRITNIEDD